MMMIDLIMTMGRCLEAKQGCGNASSLRCGTDEQRLAKRPPGFAVGKLEALNCLDRAEEELRRLNSKTITIVPDDDDCGGGELARASALCGKASSRLSCGGEENGELFHVYSNW